MMLKLLQNLLFFLLVEMFYVPLIMLHVLEKENEILSINHYIIIKKLI